MIMRIMLCTAIALFVMHQAAFGATPKKVQKKMVSAIEVESKAQAKADDWNVDKDDLVNEIRDLQTRLTWLSYQKGKHKVYVKGLQDNIAELEAKKLEARKLRENLEPYLDEVVKRLEAFISTDMPFLSQERQQRLSFLYNTLNDYQLDLGEKLRRVFESLGVEAKWSQLQMKPLILTVMTLKLQFSGWDVWQCTTSPWIKLKSANGTWTVKSGNPCPRILLGRSAMQLRWPIASAQYN